MDKMFPIIVKAFWLGTAVALAALPPTIGMMVALALASGLIVFQEWINMVKIDDETIKEFRAYKESIDAQVSDFHKQLKENTEVTTRLKTTANFKDFK